MLIIFVPVLMFFGAGLWLVVDRYLVPHEFSGRFFIYPGFGIFSDISRWLFEWRYQKDI